MTATNLNHDQLIADIRTRPAFHLCCLYLERVRLGRRHKTRGLLIGVESVIVLMRAALKPPSIWAGMPDADRAKTVRRATEARGRTSIATALADPDLAESMVLALLDNGFDVAERPQRWCEGRHYACNVSESAMFARARS